MQDGHKLSPSPGLKLRSRNAKPCGARSSKYCPAEIPRKGEKAADNSVFTISWQFQEEIKECKGEDVDRKNAWSIKFCGTVSTGLLLACLSHLWVRPCEIRTSHTWYDGDRTNSCRWFAKWSTLVLSDYLTNYKQLQPFSWSCLFREELNQERVWI